MYARQEELLRNAGDYLKDKAMRAVDPMAQYRNAGCLVCVITAAQVANGNYNAVGGELSSCHRPDLRRHPGGQAQAADRAVKSDEELAARPALTSAGAEGTLRAKLQKIFIY